MRVFKDPTRPGWLVAVEGDTQVEIERAKLPTGKEEALASLRLALVPLPKADVGGKPVVTPVLDPADLDEETAAEKAVDTSRVDILPFAWVLSCDRKAFDTWLVEHGIAAALWAVILVLRYLVACKDRQKLK